MQQNNRKGITMNTREKNIKQLKELQEEVKQLLGFTSSLLDSNGKLQSKPEHIYSSFTCRKHGLVSKFNEVKQTSKNASNNLDLKGNLKVKPEDIYVAFNYRMKDILNKVDMVFDPAKDSLINNKNQEKAQHMKDNLMSKLAER